MKETNKDILNWDCDYIGKDFIRIFKISSTKKQYNCYMYSNLEKTKIKQFYVNKSSDLDPKKHLIMNIGQGEVLYWGATALTTQWFYELRYCNWLCGMRNRYCYMAVDPFYRSVPKKF